MEKKQDGTINRPIEKNTKYVNKSGPQCVAYKHIFACIQYFMQNNLLKVI